LELTADRCAELVKEPTYRMMMLHAHSAAVPENMVYDKSATA
jgi:hypothetical protein